jgi:hypothetical protein
MRLFLLTPALILWSACASNGNKGTDEPLDSYTGSSDTGANDTSPMLEQSPSVWYGLSAELELVEFTVDAKFTLNFYSEDVSKGPSCSVEIDDSLQNKELLTPDDSILFWWEGAGLYSGESNQCEGMDRLPNHLQIGLGGIHESLLPFLSAAGLDESNASKDLYGAYIGFNPIPSSPETPGTAFVLGYAQRVESNLDTTPMSGDFSLQGVFLFPLEAAPDTGTDTDSQ